VAVLGGLLRWFGGGAPRVSEHGEIMPASDVAYMGQQVNTSPVPVDDYRLMLRDSTVASSMQVALTGMLPGLQVVASNEHDPRAMKARDICERALAAMKGSPLQTCHDLADEGRTFGYMVAEPVWMLAPEGLWTYRAVKPKRAESLRSALNCDEYGNLLSIVQSAPGAPAEVAAEDVIYWRHRGSWYEPYGRSALYEAYDPWKAKTIFVRAWAIYLQRHGQGITTWKVPHNRYAQEMARIKEILTNLQTATGIPLRSDDDVSILESSGTPGTVYQQFYQTLDKAIVRAILFQELATGEGVRVGSFAAAQTQADVMWATLRLQGEAFCESMREQLLAPLLRRNGYGDLPVPMLLPEPISAPPSPAELLTTLTGAVSAGVIPPLTPEQAQDVLARMGISAAIQSADRSAGAITTPTAEAEAAPVVAGDAALSAGSAAHVHKLAAKLSPEMARLHREMVRAEEDAAADIEAAWRAAVPGIMDRISAALFDVKANAWKTKAPGVIRDAVTAAVKHRGNEVRDALVGHLEKRYRAGQEYAGRRKRGKLAAAPAGTVYVTPTQALDALKQGAYLALQARYDSLAEDLYYSVYRAVRGDVTIREAAAQVQAVLDEEGFTLAQAETLVRTNMCQAYNEGRLEVWGESETNDRHTAEAGMIIGYRWNSVLDAATTPECSQRDGHVFAPDQVDIPPLHYNCRSVLEPIYSDDGEDVDKLPWANRADMPIPGFERKEEVKE
jgi:SPP1 gp7 family putative phage head morphogenesis protein